MARATLDLGMPCARSGCDHGVRIIVVTTIGAKSQPVSLSEALEAAALTLGMRRVHATGANPQILCAAHLGAIECRRCRFPVEQGKCACVGNPQFDVDRRIEEVREP